MVYSSKNIFKDHENEGFPENPVDSLLKKTRSKQLLEANKEEKKSGSDGKTSSLIKVDTNSNE